MNNSQQDELKMLLSKEFPNSDAIDVARLMGNHSRRNQRRVEMATRNLSVHVQEATLHVSKIRTRTVMGLAAVSCAAIAIFVVISNQDVEHLTPTVATNQSRPDHVVLPTVSSNIPTPSSTVRHTRSARSFADVNAIIVAAQEDQIVGTIADAASSVETWTIRESDLDIILGDQNDGL